MDSFDDWGDVADELERRGNKQGSQARLAEAIGLSASAVNKALGRRSGLKPAIRRRVEDYFAGRAVEGETPTMGRAAPRSNRLSVYGYAAAADGELISFSDAGVVDSIELPMGIELDPEQYFVVQAIGSSMEPRIFPGEMLVVRRNFPPGRDKRAIIEFRDGTGVIKNYRGQRDGRVFAEQFNPPKMLDYEGAKVKALHAVVLTL